jgi:hypothetical protein
MLSSRAGQFQLDPTLGEAEPAGMSATVNISRIRASRYAH